MIHWLSRRHARLAALAAACAGAAIVALPALAASPRSGPRCPTRIVSISPTATEDLFAIGAGRNVVAVDSDSNYPAAARKVRRAGLIAYSPSAEAIIGTYHPDLVVVSYDANHVVEGLRKAHVGVVFGPTAPNLRAAYHQMEALGRATCRLGAAKHLVGTITHQVNALATSTRPLAKGLTYYDEISPPAFGQDPYAASAHSFIGELFGLMGLRNISGDRSGYPQLPQEVIVAANPQLIFLSDNMPADGGVTVKGVTSRAGWNVISAVRRGAIFGLNDDAASRWGPRVVVLMRQIASAVHAYRHVH